MYPFLRMGWQIWAHRNAPPLPWKGVHVSQHRCWPWDIDLWMELNNGRTLTLYDLGRIPLAQRVGLVKVLRQNGWGLTVAGVSVRYRRRIRPFDRFEIRSRALGFDARFFYLDQSIWKDGACCNQALYRSAVTGPQGIVPTAEVAQALGLPAEKSELPLWVQNWIDAEATRPWPPQGYEDQL